MKSAKYILVASCLFIGAAPAGADCTCRSRDVVAKEGEVVCINTPLGQRLARCDKVLNNTSWTFLQGACPTASQIPAGRAVAAVQPPAPAVPILQTGQPPGRR